ncbi:hypothetical protein Tco_0648858 [Tanacetum coccineum]
MGTNDNEVGSSQSKRSTHENVEEVLLPQVYHEFLLWEGCNKDVKSRYNTRLAQLIPRHIYSPCIVNWDVLNRMGYDKEINDMLRIRVRKAESDEEIFTSVAWIRAFNINEPIYAELCHEFYSTYEFDEVCADYELQTKKIITFRLGGRAHSLTLLEFTRRLGLYQAIELEEDGFNVYFEGGLRNDDNFNAHDYLVLTEDVVRSLSAPIYCRDLDTTTLRDLIDSDGKLIPKDPQPGVPRVGIPRPPRASMQDLYDRMGRMEICQEAIERMKYRQSYHWDRGLHLTWGDKEVTMKYLELKGGDRGAYKLLGDVIEVLGCFLEIRNYVRKFLMALHPKWRAKVMAKTSHLEAKQTALVISTTEAEYISAGKACQQALWMKQSLIDYDVQLDDVPIMCDNKGAIDLSKTPVQHSRTKDIEICHHFLRDYVQKGHISIEKVPFVDNIADILTKPLKRESFNYLRLGLGTMEHIP